ncbi:hypothetical protein DFH08DRAFT_984304, partial [Mycena albidolilacea]
MGNSLEDGLLWLVTQIEEWILLFDNADDTNINLCNFFPKCIYRNIIITSCNPQLAAHAPMSHSKVEDMDETDAIDLLLVRAAKEKTVETTRRASEIVTELFCLPLANFQAGAYISKFNCLHWYLS